MSTALAFWAMWGLLFGAAELWALFGNHEGATLSETLRRWLGIYPHKPWRPFGVALVLAFSIWFPLHIIMQSP